MHNALKFARASVTGRSLPTPERPGCFLYILLKRYARESFLLYTHNDVLHPIKVNSAASRTALPRSFYFFNASSKYVANIAYVRDGFSLYFFVDVNVVHCLFLLSSTISWCTKCNGCI